jgi:hypothetical protein
MTLLWKVLRYCRKTGMPPTRFGRLAVRDPRLVHDMRRGRELGPEVQARVEAFMARGRP